jgi:hypothetical protein
VVRGTVTNDQPEIQIVDTYEFIETLISIGFAAGWPKISWTVMLFDIRFCALEMAHIGSMQDAGAPCKR